MQIEKTTRETAKNLRLRGLYVITDAQLGGGHISIARSAVTGGARIVQFRDKSGRATRAVLDDLRAVQRLTRAANALLLVNDRIDWALACGADGVHLGPDDMPVAAARRVVAALEHHAFLIGASCGSPQEARAAFADLADYIGAGAIFGTQTKLDAGAAIGLETLRLIVEATPLPVAAIGGVNVQNIASVVQSGAAMACVISAVTSAGNEGEMTRAARILAEAARL